MDLEYKALQEECARWETAYSKIFAALERAQQTITNMESDYAATLRINNAVMKLDNFGAQKFRNIIAEQRKRILFLEAELAPQHPCRLDTDEPESEE